MRSRCGDRRARDGNLAAVFAIIFWQLYSEHRAGGAVLNTCKLGSLQQRFRPKMCIEIVAITSYEIAQ